MSADQVATRELPYTSDVLAMVNLQAQIDGLARLTMVSDRAELIQLVSLRGQILGRISDYEWAGEAAEQLALDAPSDGAAFIARARARGRFHRFKDALFDLDRGQELGIDTSLVDIERAGMLQALGYYDAALKIYTMAAELRGDFESFAALATLHAERGEISIAERFFDQSQDRYHGVSPFVPAFIGFQRGHMWLRQGDLVRAQTWFEAAVQILPSYAAAQGHLAEVEAALGDPDAAIARLLPLTSSSDDPDYTASFAHILREAGRVPEARKWRDKAAARYDELIARHPEAFADHAAEFWLEAGADPDRALQLAAMNLEVRQTPHARELLTRAIDAAQAEALQDAALNALQHEARTPTNASGNKANHD